MRFLFFCTVLLTGLLTDAQVKKFIVNGSLPATAKKYTALLSWNNGAVAEEAKVVNGKFTISGEINEPVFATLSLQETNSRQFNRLEFEQNTINLFLDAGTITVASKTFLWDAEVKGSTVTNDYQQYQQQVKKLLRLESKMGEVFDAYKKEKNEKAAADVFSLYEQMSDLYYMEQAAFVTANPKSPVSLYLAEQATGNELDAAKGEPLFNMLDALLQNSEKGKELKAMIETGKKSMIGAKAIDFSQPDANGKNISLLSFKGKYVLVDFWASWCVPCRAESPTLVKAYEQYKSKNFEIFSVSLDKDKNKWLKAVKDDQYTWPQAGDMKGWENDAAAQYGISGIPFNFLLNPEGVIIARNLRGEELEKKLAALLK
jgi:thiol-disulfide isomerase/thioredoxin